MTALVWTPSKTGWGTTEYLATGTRGRYVAKRTGGRYIPWEVRLWAPGDSSWSGVRVGSASTLRSAKEAAETHERGRRPLDAVDDARGRS